MLSTVEFKNQTFAVCTQTASELIAVRNLGCCNQVLQINRLGPNVTRNLPIGALTYNYIARRTALTCFTADSLFENKVLLEYNGDKFGHDIKVPPIEPYIVPGTDTDSTYVVVAQTPHGYVARRNGGGLISPRIRVVKQDPSEIWPLEAMSLNDYSLMWQTKKADHLGHTGGSVSRTALLIAHGVEILLRIGKNF